MAPAAEERRLQVTVNTLTFWEASLFLFSSFFLFLSSMNYCSSSDIPFFLKKNKTALNTVTHKLSWNIIKCWQTLFFHVPTTLLKASLTRWPLGYKDHAGHMDLVLDCYSILGLGLGRSIAVKGNNTHLWHNKLTPQSSADIDRCISVNQQTHHFGAADVTTYRVYGNQPTSWTPEDRGVWFIQLWNWAQLASEGHALFWSQERSKAVNLIRQINNSNLKCD